ncbi:glycosyltransferase family 4 protein [Pedobacter gandavensis]|uniref:Glycosyltransferase n=1 Tax=Pedobacter gandavensis TaxID=2679963 RepID=A0ABR6ET82_9SPHI|nr:glycosyltransferase family 4 protein [Pedobacter gandavensis]MBB2148470.1 glycosyltransferase [Pedobacter gandavensis]
MTKIAHIIGVLGRGGAERFVVDLCNELAGNGQNEVYLISLCHNDPETTFRNEISAQVNYISFDKGPGFSLRVLLALTSWLVEQKIEVVHSHLNALEYLMLYRLKKTNTRFFHTIHSTAEAECPGFLIKSLRKNLYKRHLITPIVVSNDGSDSFRKYYGLNNDMVIENGRPYLSLTKEYPELRHKYKDNQTDFLLIHVGRIIKVKNQQLLIEAVQKFNAKEKQQCKLLIIGEVRDESLYQKLHELSKDDPSIEFLGGKDNIADYLSIADFFCLSSFYEGMPISLIEALSVGCISICTQVGGIKNMINHKDNGFLSKDNSVDGYYQAIKEAVYCQDKPTIRENSKNAFRLKYHIGAAERKHSQAYNS